MRKLLEQALVDKDAPQVKSRRPRKDKKQGVAPTCPKGSGQLAEEKDAKQEMDSEAESKLESLSDSDSEVGKGTGGQ